MEINIKTSQPKIPLNTVDFLLDKDKFNKEFELYNIKVIDDGKVKFIFRKQFIADNILRDKLIGEYSSRSSNGGTRTHLIFERNNSMTYIELQKALDDFNKNKNNKIIFQITPEKIEDLKPYQQLNVLLNMLANYKPNSYDVVSSGKLGNFYLLRKHLSPTKNQFESYQFINYYFGNYSMPNGDIVPYLYWGQTAFYPIDDKDNLNGSETLYKFENGNLELADENDKNVLINSNPIEKGRQTKPDDIADVASLKNDNDTLNIYRAKLIEKINKKFDFCLKRKITFTNPILFTHIQADNYINKLNKDTKNGNSLNELIDDKFQIQIVFSSVKCCLSSKQLSELKEFIAKLINNDINLSKKKVDFQFVDDEKNIDPSLPALVFVPHKNYFLSMQKYLRKVKENPKLKIYDNYFDKINSYAVQHIDLSDFFYIERRKYGDLKKTIKRKPSKLIQELNTTIRELWFKENRNKGILVSTFSDSKVMW